MPSGFVLVFIIERTFLLQVFKTVTTLLFRSQFIARKLGLCEHIVSYVEPVILTYQIHCETMQYVCESTVYVDGFFVRYRHEKIGLFFMKTNLFIFHINFRSEDNYGRALKHMSSSLTIYLPLLIFIALLLKSERKIIGLVCFCTRFFFS